jgi:hypothetical protein
MLRIKFRHHSKHKGIFVCLFGWARGQFRLLRKPALHSQFGFLVLSFVVVAVFVGNINVNLLHGCLGGAGNAQSSIVGLNCEWRPWR